MKKLKCKICGMEIKDSNYSTNSNAFFIKNSKENIEYCPFCGVESSCFVEYSDIYEKQDIKDSKTLDILEKAMKLETFNGDFYKEAAKLAKDEKIQAVFSDLSRIEYMHANVHKTLGDFKERPVLNKLNYSNNNDLMLLEIAKQREEHAISFYNKNYQYVSSNEVRQIFKELTKVEQQHIQLTSII